MNIVSSRTLFIRQTDKRTNEHTFLSSWRSQIINIRNTRWRTILSNAPKKRRVRLSVRWSYLFHRQLGITFVCQGYRWRQMTQNIIDMLLWRRGEDPENKPTDGVTKMGVVVSVVTTLMRMKTSFNFNFVLLDILRHWCWNLDTWKASNHGGTGLFLHSHGLPELRSSIWWKDEEVIILWYFDLWWMGPEIERWLLL